MKRIDKKNFSDNSREKFLNTKKIEFKFNDGTSVSPTFDVVNNFTTQIRGPETYESLAKLLNQVCIDAGKSFTDLLSIDGYEVFHAINNFLNDAIDGRGSIYHNDGIGHFVLNDIAIDNLYHSLTMVGSDSDATQMQSIFDVAKEGSEKIEDCIKLRSDNIQDFTEEIFTPQGSQNSATYDVSILSKSNALENHEAFNELSDSKEISVINEPMVNEPMVNEAMVNESMVNEPMVNEPMVNEPMVNEPMVNEPMVNEAMVNNSSAFEEISELNQASASEPQLEKDLSKDAQLNSDLLEGRESETEGLFEETDVNITPILYSVPLKLTYNDGTEKLCSLDITSQFNSAQYNQSITVPTFTSVYEPEYFESIQNKILNHNQEFSNLVSVEDMVSHNVININHNLDLVFNNTCPIVNEMAVMDLQKLLAIVCPEFEICSAPNEYSLNSVGECFEMHDDLS